MKKHSPQQQAPITPAQLVGVYEDYAQQQTGLGFIAKSAAMEGATFGAIGALGAAIFTKLKPSLLRDGATVIGATGRTAGRWATVGTVLGAVTAVLTDRMHRNYTPLREYAKATSGPVADIMQAAVADASHGVNHQEEMHIDSLLRTDVNAHKALNATDVQHQGAVKDASHEIVQ